MRAPVPHGSHSRTVPHISPYTRAREASNSGTAAPVRTVRTGIPTRSASSNRGGNDGLAELGSLLGRAYLRLPKPSRPAAVSCALDPQIPLEVSRPESPDHVVDPATRRAL
jgi:hypothetical protein